MPRNLYFESPQCPATINSTERRPCKDFAEENIKRVVFLKQNAANPFSLPADLDDTLITDVFFPLTEGDTPNNPAFSPLIHQWATTPPEIAEIVSNTSRSYATGNKEAKVYTFDFLNLSREASGEMYKNVNDNVEQGLTCYFITDKNEVIYLETPAGAVEPIPIVWGKYLEYGFEGEAKTNPMTLIFPPEVMEAVKVFPCANSQWYTFEAP